jgi:hypothetical protein
MSFESVWPHLSALHSPALTAPAVEWKVLYASRPRPLLVPAGSNVQARAAIDFFVTNRILRWWGHLMLFLDEWLPIPRLLPQARAERFPTEHLFGAGAACRTAFAVHCGSPGPLRKLTIFCQVGLGEASGEVSKVASQPSADESVSREVYWLETLNRIPALAAFLPRLIRHGTLPCGRRFMTMSALPSGLLTSRFSNAHFLFLQTLAGCNLEFSSWSRTEPFKRLQNRLAAVKENLLPAHHALFAEALAEVDRVIGPVELPVCLVHGDFAAWNLRVAADQLLVFDWEYAEEKGNPLQDFLHFHLVARATQHRMISPAYTRTLLAQAADHAARIYGPESRAADAAPYLCLHYLLDTVTFYARASGFLDVSDPVVQAYVGLLECRDQWLLQPGVPVGQAA